MRVSSASKPPGDARPSRTSSSIPHRNAASVLPEPVGAAISVWRPEGMAGRPAPGGADAAGATRGADGDRTAGWKVAGGREGPRPSGEEGRRVYPKMTRISRSEGAAAAAPCLRPQASVPADGLLDVD